MATVHTLTTATLNAQEFLNALADWMDSLDTDEPANPEPAMVATLAALRADQSRAVDALVELDMRLDADEAAARAGKARMVEMYDRRIKSIAGQRQALANQMQRLIDKGVLPETICGQLHKIWIKQPREVEVFDVEALPEDCLRIPDPEPNKLMIKQRLAAGEEVPGARWGNRKVVKFGPMSQRDRSRQY